MGNIKKLDIVVSLQNVLCSMFYVLCSIFVENANNNNNNQYYFKIKSIICMFLFSMLILLFSCQGAR